MHNCFCIPYPISLPSIWLIAFCRLTSWPYIPIHNLHIWLNLTWSFSFINGFLVTQICTPNTKQGEDFQMIQTTNNPNCSPVKKQLFVEQIYLGGIHFSGTMEHSLKGLFRFKCFPQCDLESCFTLNFAFMCM